VNKINIITPPDKIFSDCFSILLIHPGNEILNSLQNDFLSSIEENINVYNYDRQVYSPEDIDWLLSVFHYVDICIFNMDNACTNTRQLASYFIAKPKTYWLTNGDASLYNHISNNRIFNLEFLNGGYFGKTQ
jgi:hypothetical protein